MEEANMPEPALDERLKVVEELIGVFKFERYVYLGISVISFAALIFVAIRLLTKESPDYGQSVFLFGSSGAISFTGARLLRMWSDALRFILPVVGQEPAKDGTK
jgi:hypothetical protein